MAAAVTSAAALLNTPEDQPTFDIWAFSLFMNVQEINAAILAQKNVRLPAYPIYPVPFQDLGSWLLQVSEAVGNICDELHVQSVDIENVEIGDDRERQRWSYDVFSQNNQARIVLKI